MVDRLNWNGVRVLPLLLAAIVLSIVTMAAFNSHAQSAKQEAAKELFDDGFKLYQSGDFAEAKGLFDLGLQLNPESVAGSYFLGRVLEKLGDYAGAKRNYEIAVTNGPSTKEGVLAQSMLSSLEQRVELEQKMLREEMLAKISGKWCEVYRGPRSVAEFEWPEYPGISVTEYYVLEIQGFDSYVTKFKEYEIYTEVRCDTTIVPMDHCPPLGPFNIYEYDVAHGKNDFFQSIEGEAFKSVSARLGVWWSIRLSGQLEFVIGDWTRRYERCQF